MLTVGVVLRDHGVFLRPANASIWSQVQTFFQQGDDAGLHAYVREAQRLTTTQRNVCVAVAPGELEGKLIQPGNAIIMMLVSHLPLLMRLRLRFRVRKVAKRIPGRGRTK